MSDLRWFLTKPHLVINLALSLVAVGLSLPCAWVVLKRLAKAGRR